MKVILTKDKVIKEVSEGYAQNYLLPRGLAIIATPQELAKRESEFKKIEKTRKEQELIDKNIANELDGKKFSIKTEKVGSNNKLFGSITSKELAEIIGVKKENILLSRPLTELGEHPVEIKIGQFHAKVSVNIQQS